jgi:rubrerythrin
MTDPRRLENMEEIIDFAIQREREAQATYLSYAGQTDRRSFSELLLSMAEMEKEHERKLTALREGGSAAAELFTPPRGKDLGLADMLVDVPFSPGMEYGDFLVLVIRKEREAEQLYRKLEGLSARSDVRNLFALLADEERKHKDWAQQRYDEDILKEN